jgi:hypothetical protein
VPSGQPWIETEKVAPYRGDELYLGGSTKCFSCEKDMIRRGMPTYLAHPTKCFDCDYDARQKYGAWAGNFGQSNKCFSCESQYSPNPFKLESYCKKLPPGASPYCNPECRTHSQWSGFGTIGGKAINENIGNGSVGLVHGFGAADGTEGETREGDQNPIGYTLN